VSFILLKITFQNTITHFKSTVNFKSACAIY